MLSVYLSIYLLDLSIYESKYIYRHSVVIVSRSVQEGEVDATVVVPEESTQAAAEALQCCVFVRPARQDRLEEMRWTAAQELHMDEQLANNWSRAQFGERLDQLSSDAHDMAATSDQSRADTILSRKCLRAK